MSVDERDAFFDDADLPDAPAEDLLRVMTGFVTGYAKNLHEVEDAIDETLTDTWDPENDAVAVDMEPFDSESLVSMVSTENKQFNKVATVFTVLCGEIVHLARVAETRFYGPLTMFGNSDEALEEDELDDGMGGGGGGERNPNGAPEQEMGAFLPLLQDLCNFTKRCYAVARNLINQLGCLFHERQKLFLSTFKHVQLDVVFDHLAILARVLVTLDSIIADNMSISLRWDKYKRMIKYVRADPQRYGVDIEQLHTFESLLLQLDRQVISANIFEGMLNQAYGVPGAANPRALVAANKVLYDRFKRYLKAQHKRLASGLGEAVETYERVRLVELVALYAVHRRLFRETAKPDKSLYKSMWELQRKIPLVLLYGRAVWFVAEFMHDHCPLQYRSVTPQPNAVLKHRQEALREADALFNRRTEGLYTQMCMWMVRIESELVPTRSNTIGALLTARSKLIINGMLLANQVRNMLTVMLHLHLCTNTPFVKKNIRSIAVCLEMLKAIEYTYHRRSKMIGENIAHMLGQTAFTLKRIFFPIKKKLEANLSSGGTLSDDKLDVLAATNLGLLMLHGVPTTNRRIVGKFALQVAQFKKNLRDNHASEARYQLWKLNLLATWQQTVRRWCNCDFIFWATSLVPAFFADIYQHPDQVNRIQYLLAALRDPGALLASATLVAPSGHDSGAPAPAPAPAQASAEAYLSAYKDEVMGYFTSEILEPLCRDVETDLRLHIHSVVLDQDSLRRDIHDLSRFLNLKPLNFFERMIDVRSRVAHYLDQTFYNLTTVTLHDWKIYAEMRNLAYEKFNLELTDVHLPGHAHYSEALDVLEIMRNIHIFVARYNYNMNIQIFVERAFDQKHLNTINIEHIANSIRTHGTGIMNTTVNFTYQFLCRKFLIFSEFLYDDHIKSRLMKDVRFYRNEREQLNNRYPVERAEKFNLQIRKLGVSEDGLTFMDQFRRQITEIGNALGYVRMVRSGGMQHCSNAIKFVPDLQDVPDFEAGVQTSDEQPTPLAPETVEAARNLNMAIDDLQSNFAEGTGYFTILVDVFRGVFLGEKQMHLRNFFVIVPPLMLNFVDKMLAQKDTLKKKGGRGEASFTDDGFALGLAYILKLLEQDEAFDSLHWFESVQEHLRAKLEELRTKLTGSGKSRKKKSEDAQHFELQRKRFGAIHREFELLMYSFSGARIFFRDADASAAAHADDDDQQGDGAAAAAAAPPPGQTPGAAPAAPPPPGAATGAAPPAPPPPGATPGPPPAAPPMAAPPMAAPPAAVPPPLGAAPPPPMAAPPPPIPPPDIGGI